MEGGDTGMSMAGICLMPPQATIAAVQHQPFPLQCSLPASLHDPPHVQVLTDRADPLRASQAAATCVAGTVGIVEDENPAAATCVAGSSSDVCRKSALAGACDFPLPFAGQVLRSTVHSFPSNAALSFR